MTQIVDDKKGKVVHDQALKLATFFASGQKGNTVIKKKGVTLDRGYYATTIDGDCPDCPQPTRRKAVEAALLWRAKLITDKRETPKQQVSAKRFKVAA